MEHVERLIRTWVVGSGRDEEIDSVVTEITDGKTTLLNVVKCLGVYLTSEDDIQRSKGVEFLSSVVSRCPPNMFNTRSTRVLTTFFCEKLADNETIVPSLKGLLSLTTLPSFLLGEAQSTTRTLFTHIKMKTLPQSVRFQVLLVVDSLVARHREALKEVNDEFVEGYISLATGEKDPRNLMLTFAIDRVVILEFDISKFTEAMFDIIFCYFPITFRPPPDDPYKISTEDLMSSLVDCLSATPDFGPLAIPVFLEKLNAGSPGTKKDTLMAMARCLPVYGPALARASARKLWSSLKLEIFQPTNSVTEIEALKTTQVLITTIYSAETGIPSSEQQDIQGLAKDACEECLQVLREPEKSMAKPAMKVLCAFMSTTALVSRYTVSQTVPHLITLFRNPDEASSCPSILRLLSDLSSAARDADQNDSASESQEIAFFPYKDDVLSAAVSGLKNAPSRKPAVELLKSLVTTRGLCTNEEMSYIVLSVDEYLQPNPEDSEDSSDAILDLLSTVALSNPRLIQDQTLPLLFSELPDTAESLETQAQRDRCWLTLGALTQLCITPDLFGTLVIRLTTKLDLISIPSGNSGVRKHREAYVYSLLAALVKTLEKKVELRHPDVAKYIDGLVWRLYNLFIYSALSHEEENQLVASDPRLISIAGKVINLVIQTLSQQQQETFSKALFDLYLNGNTAAIGKGQHKIPADSTFSPFQSTSNLQRSTVVLFTAAIIALRKEVLLTVPDLNSFLLMIMIWSLNDANHKTQREAAWHLTSSIVNKHVDELQPFLTDVLEKHWPKEVLESAQPTERRVWGIHYCIWVSKALLIRNHPLLKQFTELFLNSLGDKAISWDIAKGVGRIASKDNVLTKSNHCITKILYAQKFFDVIFQRLIHGATDSLNVDQQNEHMVMLTGLLTSVPRAIYMEKLTTLMPLLLRSLEIPDLDIRADTIDTLLSIAEEDSIRQGIIAEHVSTLVSAMLKNALIEGDHSSRVKVAALKYLSTLPDLVRYDLLHPHKATVLRELAKALDDPRKSVRKEAVDARTNWFKCAG